MVTPLREAGIETAAGQLVLVRKLLWKSSFRVREASYMQGLFCNAVRTV